MSDKLIKMHGAVSEVIVKAIAMVSDTYTTPIYPARITVSLSKILGVARVTPRNRLAWHDILKERNITCEVSSIVKDNYHLTVELCDVIMTAAEAKVYDLSFTDKVNPVRITKYIS